MLFKYEICSSHSKIKLKIEEIGAYLRFYIWIFAFSTQILASIILRSLDFDWNVENPMKNSIDAEICVVNAKFKISHQSFSFLHWGSVYLKIEANSYQQKEISFNFANNCIAQNNFFQLEALVSLLNRFFRMLNFENTVNVL